MIPETIPSTSSQGEKRLFAVLRDRFDDTYIAWHNPKIKDLEADFVILSPTFGLLIIEVKGHYYNQIKRADNNFLLIERKIDGVKTIEREVTPLQQCRGYMFGMMDRIKCFPVLCHQDGDFQGKALVPLGHGAVMSNITTQKASGDLFKVLPPPQVAYSDELINWQDMEQSAIASRLKQMFTVYFNFDELTPDQISTIRGILYPEFVAKTEPATSDSVAAEVELPDNSQILKTLDIKQERLARSIGDGHRLFSGVAGSGKTIILLARAKYLISRESERKILILCYNITLAAYLRSLLHEDELNPEYKKIEVWHFHEWARKILGRLPSPNSTGGEGDPEGYLGQILGEKIAQIESRRLWDSILIDEAHTFHPEWFRCCVNALKDPEHGSLTIVSDGSQNLYQRTKFSWISVGVKAQGRSKKLSQNYRNTQEILSAAWSVIESIDNREDSVEDRELEATFPIVKPSAALRNGVKPTLYLASSPQAEIEAMVTQIRALVDGGQKPEAIAVIYRLAGKNSYEEKLIKLLIQTLQQQQISAYWITERGTSGKAKYSTRQPGVRIVTALSSLGLEFNQVMIPWVQQYDRFADNADALLRNRRQFYVAMTRAQEQLYLFASGRSKIRSHLEQSEHLNLVNL